MCLVSNAVGEGSV